MRGESSLTGSAAFCCRKLTMSCTSAGASGGTCAKVQQALDVAIDVLLLEAVLQLVYHLLVEVCAMEKTEELTVGKILSGATSLIKLRKIVVLCSPSKTSPWIKAASSSALYG